MTIDQANLIANGNKDAARFVLTFVAWCHLLDDIIDRDKPVTDERLMAENLAWVVELAGNPFWLQHRAMLLGLIVQCMNAWLDSNRLATSSIEQDKIAADVLKGHYHEVVWHVAYLTGGWPHLRRVTQEHREYDFEARAGQET